MLDMSEKELSKTLLKRILKRQCISCHGGMFILVKTQSKQQQYLQKTYKNPGSDGTSEDSSGEEKLCTMAI